MVAPRLSGLAEAPPGLLDCIFRRGKWARETSAPATSHVADGDTASRDEGVRRYALAALDNQIRKVEAAGKGTRNQTLNDAVLSLGHLVAAGALPEAMVRQLLEEAASVCGLVKDDGVGAVRATINSALRAGMRQPANLADIGRRSAPRRRPSSATIGTQPSHQGKSEASRELAYAGEPLTDLGNAQRFVKHHGESFRSCPVLGWLGWVGDHWSLDAAEGLIDRAVHEVVRGIKAESDAARVQKWAHTSQGARHIGCISKLARPYLEIGAASLDADPFLINVKNGTLVVRRSDDHDYVLF
jgi:putative DNA primase/helicase